MIKKLVQQLSHRYGTIDPFRIANNLGFILIDTPLVGVRGFYQYLHRCHIIYTDSSLNDQDRAFVCAHELGHALLHKGINRIFMDTRTFAISSRYEREADQFAACLLYTQMAEELRESCTIPQIAETLHIDEQLAAWLIT